MKMFDAVVVIAVMVCTGIVCHAEAFPVGIVAKERLPVPAGNLWQRAPYYWDCMAQQEERLRWIKVQGKPVQGLANRRRAEMEGCFAGKWQLKETSCHSDGKDLKVIHNGKTYCFVLPQGAFASAVMFQYNIGSGAWINSTDRKKMNSGSYIRFTKG